MVNYQSYRTSLEDFGVGISTCTGKGKGRNDARLSLALMKAPINLPVWSRMTKGNNGVNSGIGTSRQDIKGPRKTKKIMIEGMYIKTTR